jgi:predicted nucleotidyltransferase
MPEAFRKLSYNRVVSHVASALELNPALKALLSELRRRLEDLYRDRLVRVVLFGSQARGEGEPWSDLDVLVVLKGPVRAGDEIRRTSAPVAELCLRNNVVISRLFVDEAAFMASDNPLLENVRAEGIEL